MDKVSWSGSHAVAVAALALAALVAMAPGHAQAQEKLTGKAFDAAVVKDFYLEGNAIPVQTRNTVVLKGADGKRMVFGLLDTSGYSTEIQQKYAGMLILERKTQVGSAAVTTGAYGFGLRKGTPPEGPGTLVIYDVGGEKVGEAPAQWDTALARPVPLQVLNGRLYVGRHWVDIK